MKTLKTILCLVMAALMLMALVACGEKPAEKPADKPADNAPADKATDAPADKPAEKETLVIITGTQGGSYYIMASAVATLLEQYSDKYTASVVSSSAVTVESILKLQAHEAAMGFAVSGQVYGAYTGNPDETTAKMVTEQCGDLRLLAGSHSGEIHLIVKKSAGIKTVADLEGKAISISNTGTGANIEMTRLLRVAGLDGKYTGVNSSMQESIDALKDSAVDVAQVTSGWPAPVVQDACASMDVEFFRMPEEIIDATIAEAPYLMKTVIPAGTYPNQDEEYITLSIPNAIYIHAGLSDEVVTELCEILFGHYDELVATYGVFKSYTPENTIAASAAIPLHPAVEAYFKAKGWM